MNTDRTRSQHNDNGSNAKHNIHENVKPSEMEAFREGEKVRPSEIEAIWESETKGGAKKEVIWVSERWR